MTQAAPFLPMTPEEAVAAHGADAALDVILVTGDAYVDHPAWGVAAIGRWLEAHGFRVGVIAQPDHGGVEAFRALGRPRLFFGVTAGNMDSMVNRFTASRRLRSQDAYSPGGIPKARPDRATIPYTSRCKQAFPGVPVVVGGIEASLRRLVHYDFWQDRIRGSILLDAKADLLVYGMGELAVLEIARRLAAGMGIKECRDIPGTAWATGANETPPAEQVIVLPSLDACRSSGDHFNTVTRCMYRESNPANGRALVQAHGARAVVQNPPMRALTTAELDRLHELPFAGTAHPCYRSAIPALTSIKGSIAVNRGCSGGCSFCALTIHQGKDVVSRSSDSVLREIGGMVQRPGFDGIITDLGGPTANMYHLRCTDDRAGAACRRVSCLHPTRCKFYGTDHAPYVALLRAARSIPGIRRVYVNSGIRYDLAALDDTFVEELAAHHVQGQLSVAPEHASPTALAAMKKPDIRYFDAFMERFRAASAKAGKTAYVVPYFQCAHPGVGPSETVELARYMKREGLKPRQVQMFMPTPGTLATAMYVSGKDPLTHEPVHVVRGDRERSRQRALLFWWSREHAPFVREALVAWGYASLIGRGPEHLVPPGPAWGSWTERGKAGRGAIRYDTHEGMTVERASPEEEAEQPWEAVEAARSS